MKTDSLIELEGYTQESQISKTRKWRGKGPSIRKIPYAPIKDERETISVRRIKQYYNFKY
jgi:hypothetical protein